MTKKKVAAAWDTERGEWKLNRVSHIADIIRRRVVSFTESTADDHNGNFCYTTHFTDGSHLTVSYRAAWGGCCENTPGWDASLEWKFSTYGYGEAIGSRAMSTHFKSVARSLPGATSGKRR